MFDVWPGFDLALRGGLKESVEKARDLGLPPEGEP